MNEYYSEVIYTGKYSYMEQYSYTRYIYIHVLGEEDEALRPDKLVATGTVPR